MSINKVETLIASFFSRHICNRQREAIVLRVAFVGVLTRFFNIFAGLATVPIVLHHLGKDRYGVWMAALSIATWFSLADGGICNGLVSQVAKATGSGDRPKIRVLVASALAVTASLVAIFLTIFLVIAEIVDWNWVFNLSNPAVGVEAKHVVMIICASNAAAFPATVVRQTRLGLLQGSAVAAWDLCAAVLSFVGLIAVVNLGFGLEGVALVWAGSPSLVRNLSAILFLAGEGRDLTPSSWRDVKPGVSRSLLGAGSAYTIYTLALALGVQSDQFLIARFFGVAAVTEYSIVQRLFSQPPILANLYLSAQWPAYGEAYGRRDTAWVERQFWRTLMAVGIAGAIICGLLGLFCKDILHLWVGDSVAVSSRLIATMTVNGVVVMIASVVSYFYMASELHRPLMGAQIAIIAINVPLTIFLLPRIGSPGAVVSTTTCYLLAVILPGIVIARQTLLRSSFSKAVALKTSDRESAPTGPGASP